MRPDLVLYAALLAQQPAQDDSGVITVSLTAANLLTIIGFGGTGFSGSVFLALKWFLNKLDEKDAKSSKQLDEVMNKFREDLRDRDQKFLAALHEVEERAENNEERVIGVVERSVTAIERVKSGLDKIDGRLMQVETKMKVGTGEHKPLGGQ